MEHWHSKTNNTGHFGSKAFISCSFISCSLAQTDINADKLLPVLSWDFLDAKPLKPTFQHLKKTLSCNWLRSHHSEVLHPCMDLLITLITILPYSKEYFVINVTYISGAFQQQGEEPGIGQCLLQLPSSWLCSIVHEVFPSILIDIRGTDVNTMASLQLTNLGVLCIWEILSCYEICFVELPCWKPELWEHMTRS